MFFKDSWKPAVFFMKTQAMKRSITVIWCDWGDNDTFILDLMWKNLPENVKVNVVHITEWNSVMEKAVELAIKNETDTLLFCGHGTEYGLLAPKRFGIYVLHEENVFQIKANNVIGISCHCSEFAKLTGLHGFFSSMFISNVDEAEYYSVNATVEQVTRSNLDFFRLINRMLSGEIDNHECISMMEELGKDNPVSKFNAEGMEIL